METWNEVKLKDFADIKGGKRLPKGKQLAGFPTAHPYIRIRDIGKSKILQLTSEYEYIDDETQKEISRYIVSKGDILISVVGTIGIVGIVGNTLDGANQTENCDRLTNFKNIDRDFLYYYLVSPRGQGEIAKGIVGAVQPKLPLKNIQDFTMRLPSLQTQKNIASVLSALDDKIEKNTEINKNLEQQAAAYFHHQFIVNAAPSWKEGTISDLGTVIGGSTPSKSKPEYYTDNGIAWITPKDLSVDKSKFISHGADDITELGLRNSSASIMPAGTVLFSSRAPIGYIAIADGEVTTNQGFKSVVPNGNVGTAFVYYFLKNALPTIENMASGSTFKEISGSAMRTVPAVIPDDGSLQEFSDFCEPLFQQQRTLEAENHSLAALRDSLLPKLMSGELDVSELDL